MRITLTFSELETESAELLPARETLFLNANWTNIAATNSSMALNAASVYANASSQAVQQIAVNQG